MAKAARGLEHGPLEVSVHSTRSRVGMQQSCEMLYNRPALDLPVVRVSVKDGKIGHLLSVEGVDFASPPPDLRANTLGGRRMLDTWTGAMIERRGEARDKMGIVLTHIPEWRRTRP